MDIPDAGTGEEAGALDNRLSLNPNDPMWKDKVGEWEDGQEYNVTLKVRQISPGEFEVVGMEGGDAAEEAAEPADTVEGEEDPAGEGENPAMMALMAQNRE